MKIPVETKPALWGVAGGADRIGNRRIHMGRMGHRRQGRGGRDATGQLCGRQWLLHPVCVEKFQHTPDVSTNLAALKKVDSWSQGAFVEKGGWATVPGSNAPRTSVGGGQSMRVIAHQRVADAKVSACTTSIPASA